MADLLFANAGLPINALTTFSGSLSADSTYPLSNLFGGNRTDVHRLASAASGDYRIAFDMGTTSTRTANFLYIARASLLQYGTVGTVSLKAASANIYGSATTIHQATSFTSATLYGPASDDYVATFSTSASFRYWWVNYNASSATKFPHAKVFFGTYFDPGINPNGPMVLTRTRPLGGQRKALHTFTLQYNSLPYAKVIELHDTFYRTRRHNPMILFTTASHDLLFGVRVLFCRMLSMTMPPRVTNYYDCEITVEEVL